jgi:hypothetical protein
MLQLLLRFVSTMGTVITAASVVWASGQQPALWVRLTLITLIVTAFAVTAMDYARYKASRPKRYALNSAGIKSYMAEWLSSGGRAAVFSRDLSWAAEGDTARLLEAKAGRGELIVFAGRETAELTRLAAGGAAVHNYGGFGFEPKARFTIVDYGKAGARLAIGFAEDGEHVIYEYGAGDHAVMALAGDLVALARATTPKASL